MAGLAYGWRPFLVQCNPRGTNSQNPIAAPGSVVRGNGMLTIGLPLIASYCEYRKKEAPSTPFSGGMLRVYVQAGRGGGHGCVADHSSYLVSSWIPGHLRSRQSHTQLVTALPVQHFTRRGPTSTRPASNYCVELSRLDFRHRTLQLNQNDNLCAGIGSRSMKGIAKATLAAGLYAAGAVAADTACSSILVPSYSPPRRGQRMAGPARGRRPDEAPEHRL